jgi:hypothetical protein
VWLAGAAPGPLAGQRQPLPCWSTRASLRASEHQGDARPDTLLYLRVGAVDAIAPEFAMAVEAAPWAREVELRDPDGNRLRIGTPTS